MACARGFYEACADWHFGVLDAPEGGVMDDSKNE